MSYHGEGSVSFEPDHSGGFGLSHLLLVKTCDVVNGLPYGIADLCKGECRWLAGYVGRSGNNGFAKLADHSLTKWV